MLNYTTKLYTNLSSCLFCQYIPYFTKEVKTLCAWSSLVLEKGLPMMDLTIPTMLFCADPVCVDHWLPQRQSSILSEAITSEVITNSPGSTVLSSQRWLPQRWLSISQDQQCWSSQRQSPQRWLSIPLQNQQCWSSQRWLPQRQSSIDPSPTDFPLVNL